MTARMVPWFAAVLLVVLGWYAFAPVWTQGLGGVVTGADGQPALWLAAVRAGWLAILAAMACCLWFWPMRGQRRQAGFVRSRFVATCALVMVMILYLAMAGQPLRLWFLVSNAVWCGPFAAGGASLLGCGVFVLAAGRISRMIGALLALATAGAWGTASPEILAPFYAGNAFPACIDWTVLAFALSCGAFAAWMNTDHASAVARAGNRQKDF